MKELTGELMKNRLTIGILIFVAGVICGAIGPTTLLAEGTGLPSTKMVYRGDLANLPGQEVLIFASDWAPGHQLPLHMHPNGHELVYVVQGEQTFQIEGIGEKLVKTGEVLHTQPNVPHFGRNATNGLSKTVVIRIKDKDQPITIGVKK